MVNFVKATKINLETSRLKMETEVFFGFFFGGFKKVEMFANISLTSVVFITFFVFPLNFRSIVSINSKCDKIVSNSLIAFTITTREKLMIFLNCLFWQ